MTEVVHKMMSYSHFGIGVAIGTFATLVVIGIARRNGVVKEDKWSPDPINIRRREFSRLKGEVDSLFRMIKEYDERIGYLEKY